MIFFIYRLWRAKKWYTAMYPTSSRCFRISPRSTSRFVVRYLTSNIQNWYVTPSVIPTWSTLSWPSILDFSGTWDRGQAHDIAKVKRANDRAKGTSAGSHNQTGRAGIAREKVATRQRKPAKFQRQENGHPVEETRTQETQQREDGCHRGEFYEWSVFYKI